MASTASQNSPSSAYDLTALSQVNTITNVKDEYPAVNLVAALLRQIAVNVNTVPRDVHTNAEILRRSNTVYEAIIQAMKKLDEAPEEALSDTFWDSFDDYTTAIPIIEKILLNLPHATATLDVTKSQIPPATSTQEAITHIHAWVADRTHLKETFKELDVGSLKKLSSEASTALVEEYVTKRIKDDNSIAKSLLDFIKKSPLENKHVIKDRQNPAPNVISDVKSLADTIISDIAGKPANEDLSGLVVRSLMLAYIPFAVITASTVSKDWQVYLRKAAVWTAIKDLLNKVKDEIAQSAGAKLDAEFDKVEKLLLNLGDVAVNTAKAMLQLIKLSAHIPRPYSGRVASLVKAIYSVDQFSRKDENKALQEHRYTLKETMETTHTALTEVKEAAYDLQSFSLKSKEYATRRDSIKALLSGVQSLFTTFGITDKWAPHDTEFGNSVSTDEDHIKKAHDIIFPKA